MMARDRVTARQSGKSDPIDAAAVGLAALREPDLPVAQLDGPQAFLKRRIEAVMNAFNPDKNGPLTDAALESGEQKAIQFLFAGAIGAFKNPSSHRQVDYEDPTVAAEAVLLADLLMRMLDRFDTK